MAVFIDIWPCLFTTKLSYAQLFKRGHSKLSSHLQEKQNHRYSDPKAPNG